MKLLGQHEEVMEYRLNTSPKPIISVVDEGIFINAIRSQRTNKEWHNPVVFKLNEVEYNENSKDLE